MGSMMHDTSQHAWVLPAIHSLLWRLWLVAVAGGWW